jgi:signal transduction histidine kinase
MMAVQSRKRIGASFVSTVRPTAGQRKAARWIGAVSLLVFALTAPFAKMPLAEVSAFLPIYQSALVVFDLITCVLLFGQYRMMRSPPLLLLASGYLFSALMATAHALSFPGLFAPSGAIGAGPQTTAWLYFSWHAGFALFILAYAIAQGFDWSKRLPNEMAWMLGLAGIAAAAPIVFSTVFQDLLPTIMSGNMDAPAKLAVAFPTWLVGIVALLVLQRRRVRTVLDLWLMVVLCVWIADTALASVLNHGRFDLGWYTGRMYGLMANGFVLAVLLLESGSLYARLAKSHHLLAEAMAEMRRLNTDLEALAGSLAHDLQQPLVTIAGFAQVIQRGNLSARETEHLQKIVEAADSARGMIRALLEFARIGESGLKTEAVDLNEIVAQARNAAASGAPEREVEWKIAPLPSVQGDASLLRLAFINLLSNAMKYSRTQERPVISVEAHAHAPEGHLIQVRDNGVGFDMSQAGRLFSPFERLHSARDFEGTGMGLANVRRIVERHGGTVTAQSLPGQGATFSVILHAAARTPAALPRAVAAAVPLT